MSPGPLVQIHRRCPHPPHHNCAALATRQLRDDTAAPPFSQIRSTSASFSKSTTSKDEAPHVFVSGEINFLSMDTLFSDYRYRKIGRFYLYQNI